jgi:hypothetical protein
MIVTENPFEDRLEDFVNRGLRSAVGALPVIGHTAVEFLDYLIGDPARERRDDFMREIWSGLQRLASNHEDLKAETLRANEQFRATFIQATQLSVLAVQNEKRMMLRNAVLNSAIGTVDENVRQIFMQCIERLTALHVALLKLLDDPASNPSAKRAAAGTIAAGVEVVVKPVLPQIFEHDGLFSRIATDLHGMGLLSSTLSGTMSASGLLARRTTDFGRSFLSFISDPTS